MNLTDEGRRKGAESLRRRREATPDTNFSNNIRANKEFVKRLKGRCFCGPKRHNPNCEHYKCGSD